MAREIVYKFSSCFINDIRSRRRVPPLIRQMCHPCSRWVQRDALDLDINGTYGGSALEPISET
jgi:hypothetical protein